MPPKLAVDYESFFALLKENHAAQVLPFGPPPILGFEDVQTRDVVLEAYAQPKMFALLLIQSGYAALAIGKGDKIIEHRVIRRYMTRKSQGQSQLNYLETKGKSRLGSRIRLNQTRKFLLEISEWLIEKNRDHPLGLLFLSCAPKLKGALLQVATDQGLSLKDDPRWRKVPFHCHRPNAIELARIHKSLCQAVQKPSLGAIETAFTDWPAWQEWALSPTPGKALESALAEDLLHSYPEILNIIGVKQDPKWHPEGDVWIHTLYVLDEAARIASREGLSGEERTILVLAALCHDLGKPATTVEEGERIHARGHAQKGVGLSEILLKRMACPEKWIQAVTPLVAEHQFHLSYDKLSQKAFDRLLSRLQPSTVRMLCFLIEADASGRPPLPRQCPVKAVELLELAQKA